MNGVKGRGKSAVFIFVKKYLSGNSQEDIAMKHFWLFRIETTSFQEDMVIM